MAFLVVVGEKHHCRVYETESEFEAEILGKHVVVYEKPDWWDGLSTEFWETLCWALQGCDMHKAKRHVLQEHATALALPDSGGGLV